MNELIKKLMETGNTQALQSHEALQSAAQALDFSADEVAAAVAELGNFPLTDDELQEATAGYYKYGKPKELDTSKVKLIF